MDVQSEFRRRAAGVSVVPGEKRFQPLSAYGWGRSVQQPPVNAVGSRIDVFA